jgi:hypothetical protein
MKKTIILFVVITNGQVRRLNVNSVKTDSEVIL